MERTGLERQAIISCRSSGPPFTMTLERMQMQPLIPPHEAPPSKWRQRDESFNWRRAALGAIVGSLVGLIAFLYDAPPWWWLAVLVGFASGGASKHIDMDVPAQWSRK